MFKCILEINAVINCSLFTAIFIYHNELYKKNTKLKSQPSPSSTYPAPPSSPSCCFSVLPTISIYNVLIHSVLHNRLQKSHDAL